MASMASKALLLVLFILTTLVLTMSKEEQTPTSTTEKSKEPQAKEIGQEVIGDEAVAGDEKIPYDGRGGGGYPGGPGGGGYPGGPGGGGYPGGPGGGGYPGHGYPPVYRRCRHGCCGRWYRGYCSRCCPYYSAEGKAEAEGMP